MKKIMLFTLLCVVLFAAAGNFELRAQEVGSKYGGSFSESVANQQSPLLRSKTVLEQRDYGVDLFITGMVLGVVAPAILTALIPVVVGDTVANAIVTGSDENLDHGALAAGVGLYAGASLLSTIGFGLWLAGAIYWGLGNRYLRDGIALGEGKDADVLLALDTQINGIGVVLKY